MSHFDIIMDIPFSGSEFSEKGSSIIDGIKESDAREKLINKVADLASGKVASDSKLTYLAAFEQVLKENPDLAEKIKAHRQKQIKEKIGAMDEEAVLNPNGNFSENNNRSRIEFISFCDALASEGKIRPDARSMVVDLMTIFSRAAAFEFSEGTRKRKDYPLNRFKSFLEGLPKRELSSIESVNLYHERIHKRTLAVSKEKGIPYREALSMILKEED